MIIFKKKHINTLMVSYFFKKKEGFLPFFLFNSSEHYTERYHSAQYLLSLRKSKWSYVIFHSILNKDPLELIEWVKNKNYHFRTCKLSITSFDCFDFSGSLEEISGSFFYRIYDTDLVKKIYSILSDQLKIESFRTDTSNIQVILC